MPSTLPSLSVAMCTYNGARFIESQLESIASQTMRPQELVVCDDASTDHTVAILRKFAQRSPFPVHVKVNPNTIGSTRNFAAAIALCDNDIIALADQDDLWLPTKLEVTLEAFAKSPDSGLVFSDAQLMDGHGRPLSQTLWSTRGFGHRKQRYLLKGKAHRVLLKRNIVTGATLAFRACHRDLVLPIPVEWVHDGWIAFMISAVAVLHAVQCPLVKYRLHKGNQIGISRLSFFEQLTIARTIGPEHYVSEAERYCLARKRLQTWGLLARRPQLRADLDAKIFHLSARATIAQRKASGSSTAIRELLTGRYHRYSRGIRSFAKDVFPHN